MTLRWTVRRIAPFFFGGRYTSPKRRPLSSANDVICRLLLCWLNSGDETRLLGLSSLPKALMPLELCAAGANRQIAPGDCCRPWELVCLGIAALPARLQVVAAALVTRADAGAFENPPANRSARRFEWAGVGLIAAVFPRQGQLPGWRWGLWQSRSRQGLLLRRTCCVCASPKTPPAVCCWRASRWHYL